MSEKDLHQKLKEMDEELVKLYAEASTGTQVKSPGKIRQVKKTRARVKTVLNSRGSSDHE